MLEASYPEFLPIIWLALCLKTQVTIDISFLYATDHLEVEQVGRLHPSA